MKRTALIAGLVVAAVSFSAGYYLRRTDFQRASNELTPPDRRTSSVALPPDPIAFERGRALAQTYCTPCHSLPDPQLLTKTAWAHHILPQMALWLGIEKVNYESLPDGRLLEEAQLFTTTPMLSQEDWFAICDYYRAAAPNQPPLAPTKAALQSGLKNFRVRKLNFHSGMPTTSLVKIDAARKRLYVADAFAGLLATLDSTGAILDKFRVGPAVGITSKNAGLYVTLIGRFFPSDALEGAIAFLPDQTKAQPEPLLTGLRRPSHTSVADLNKDSRDDLVVCSFGNRLGRCSWFESKQGGYEEHLLVDRAGAVRSEVYDFNRDDRPDIVVMMSQSREAIYIFYNEGHGQFRSETITEQQPVFGYVDFKLVDFNRDGYIDIITANGDNGDNPTPHKGYHGLRLLLNDGRNLFREAWFYPMEGAYQVAAVDFDQDGDLDIAAISFYPDYQSASPETFVYLENVGKMQFQAKTVPESAAGRWMVMDTGDLDADGDSDLVLGSFALGPTTIPIPPSVRENWKTNGAAVLILENTLR